MKEFLKRSISYYAYRDLIDALLAEGKTTGPKQSEAMTNYARINRQRMTRLDQTVVLGSEVKAVARRITRPMIWLILTEGWCGDAAQNVPIIEKIARESDIIETRYILRDENPELMDRFLTNGARAIPKLIALDAATLELLGTWGARPKAAQDLFVSLKASGAEKGVVMEEIQRWYNADRSRSLQDEFTWLLAEWNEQPQALAA